MGSNNAYVPLDQDVFDNPNAPPSQGPIIAAVAAAIPLLAAHVAPQFIAAGPAVVAPGALPPVVLLREEVLMKMQKITVTSSLLLFVFCLASFVAVVIFLLSFGDGVSLGLTSGLWIACPVISIMNIFQVIYAVSGSKLLNNFVPRCASGLSFLATLSVIPALVATIISAPRYYPVMIVTVIICFLQGGYTAAAWQQSEMMDLADQQERSLAATGANATEMDDV